MEISIKAFKNASIKIRGFEQFYLARKPEYFTAYVYIFLIKLDGKYILIDAGLPVPEKLSFMNKKWVRESGDKNDAFLQEKNEEIPLLLKSEELKPEDINYVILTHLHLDHIGGLDLFKNAKIIFSRKGWGFFHSSKFPLMAPREQIPDYILKYIVFNAWDRVYLNEDEEEILPNIKVFWLGGHSRCSQGIEIMARDKKFIFCGDVVGTYKNIEENIPIGLVQNLEETLVAMERIKNSGGIIIPSHDPEILNRFPDGIII